MRVTNNNQNLLVGWNYTKTVKNFHGQEKQVDVTTCYIKNESGDIIEAQQVVRKNDEPFCRDTARKFSLNKTLLQLFPEEREIRRKFWDVYLSRNKKTEETQ